MSPASVSCCIPVFMSSRVPEFLNVILHEFALVGLPLTVYA
jgi:hypothetical protein